jgi:hypothetical protein
VATHFFLPHVDVFSLHLAFVQLAILLQASNVSPKKNPRERNHVDALRMVHWYCILAPKSVNGHDLDNHERVYHWDTLESCVRPQPQWKGGL